MGTSAQDIHNKKFRQARMRGYNADDVDEFLDELATGLEQDEAEVSRLKLQVQEMNEKVTSYSGMEGTLNSAIISAQKLADETKANALVESSEIVDKAKQEAGRLMAQAQADSAQERSDAGQRQRELLASIERLEAAENKFKQRFRDVLADYEALIEQKSVESPRSLIEAESQLVSEEPVAAAIPEPEPAPEPIDEPEPEVVPEPEQVPEPEVVDDAPTEEFQAEYLPADAATVERPMNEPVAEIDEAPVEEADVSYEEASEEQVAETPIEEEIEDAPAANAVPQNAGLEISDEDRSSREIADAVERMKKMLGDDQAGATQESPRDEEDQNLFEAPVGGPEEQVGFGDLGEGVPGVRKRRRPEESNPESEVD